MFRFDFRRCDSRLPLRPTVLDVILLTGGVRAAGEAETAEFLRESKPTSQVRVFFFLLSRKHQTAPRAVEALMWKPKCSLSAQAAQSFLRGAKVVGQGQRGPA